MEHEPNQHMEYETNAPSNREVESNPHCYTEHESNPHSHVENTNGTRAAIWVKRIKLVKLHVGNEINAIKPQMK